MEYLYSQNIEVRQFIKKEKNQYLSDIKKYNEELLSFDTINVPKNLNGRFQKMKMDIQQELSTSNRIYENDKEIVTEFRKLVNEIRNNLKIWKKIKLILES